MTLGTFRSEANWDWLNPRLDLECLRGLMHTQGMGTKQIVEDLLQKLPENVTLHDVAREIEFVASVRQGLVELDRGEGVPLEEVERELPAWVIK